MWKKLTNINKILVPVDLTDSSLCAVEAALTFAIEKKTQIYLIHVIHKVTGNSTPGTSGITHGGEQEAAREYRALDEFFQNKIRPQSRFAYIVRSGVPSVEILTFAREEAVDLVVMPIGSARGPDAFSLDGIAGQIIEKAGVPVLIVKGDTVVKKHVEGKHMSPAGR